MRRAVIGVMGSGEASPSSMATARELGRLVAERGWVLLTGGRPVGVMAAACAGAKQVAGSVTLGILPSSSGGVGADVDLAVFTGMGDARNAINVLSSDVVVACGVEGPGTASEVALGLKAAKPVILLCATPHAAAFFQELHCAGRLFEAPSAPEAIRLIEQVLQVPRGPHWEIRG
jgi:uncharacterized protein (TIGR00725 family)